MKTDTASISIQDLEAIYRAIINKPDLVLPDPQKSVIDVIHAIADEIAQEALGFLEPWNPLRKNLVREASLTI